MLQNTICEAPAGPLPLTPLRKGEGTGWRHVKTCVVAAAVMSLYAATSAAAGDIMVSAPWLRATPPHASVAGGYATILNTGTSDDRLVGASIPMAPKGEIHSMSMENGVMHMKRLDKGLAIPAGKTVELTPAGYHMMFIKPTARLKEGETVRGELIFEKAGKVPVAFLVAGFGAKAAPK